MLLPERHFCMPAAMAMILLAGIVVNNAILLVDFIETFRKKIMIFPMSLNRLSDEEPDLF